MNVQECVAQQAEGSATSARFQFAARWRRVVAWLQRRHELAQQRRRLRDLDEHMLKDIGLSRADVARIAGRRWFWEEPLNRCEDLDQRYRSSDHQRRG